MKRFLQALGFAAMSVGSSAGADDEPDYAAARAELVREVEQQVAELGSLVDTSAGGRIANQGLAPAVAAALNAVPRHAFVPADLRGQAYRNHPLPIGNGQTISQPLIVALMSQLLAVGAGDRVYELGTGSGYQAAVLAAMGVEVYSVEIVAELATKAAQLLDELGYRTAHVRAGDGYQGWPDAAPFDGVIVTAAIDHVPEPLVEQLKPGGRLVIPLGATGGVQQLAVFVKGPDGKLARRDVLAVQFVPVTGPRARTD
jgi:protein-L-isoaspartate(D-aspartate) O-methyltransferase